MTPKQPMLDQYRDVPYYMWAVAITASTTLVAMAKSTYDAYLLGQTSSGGLAAFAIVFPIMTLAISLGRGIYTGSAAYFQVDARSGMATISAAKFMRATLVSIGSGLVVFALIFLSLPILLSTQQYKAYGPELRGFFLYWGLSIPLMFVSANAFAAARNLGHVNAAGAFTLVGNIVGVGLSIWLIPKLALAGAALSILGTSVVSTSLCVALALRHTTPRAVEPINLAPLLQIALPVSAAHLLQFFSLGAITAVFSSYGVETLAAYALVGRLEQLLLSMQIAFTTVSIIAISKYRRAGPDQLASYIHKVVALMTLVALLEWLLALALGGVMGAALNSAESRSFFSFYLYYLSGTVLFQGVFILSITMLNVIGRPGPAFLLSVAAYCGVQPAIAFGLQGALSAPALLLCICLSWLICAFGAYVALRAVIGKSREATCA